jgi:F-type H+-transporting ATPase subunit b
MIAAIVQFGESSSGLGTLGVDGQALIIQLITFVLAILVLRKWAVKPILRVMNERRETIEKGVKLGEDMQKEKAKLEQQVEDRLHEARVEADRMIANAQETARETIREAEEKARTKAENIVAEAEGRIVTETARARRELEKELAGLVADATEAVIDEKIDAKKDSRLIERALKGKERQTA